MLQGQLMDLLGRAQRGGWGAELLDPGTLCEELEQCTERGALLDAADGVRHHQGRYPALQALQRRLAEALVRNPLTPKVALLGLAEDEDILRAVHQDLCKHPCADEQVLLEAAHTASRSLLGMPEVYRSIEEAAPGLGRAAEVTERVRMHLVSEYQEVVTGLGGHPEAVMETFITLFLDRNSARAASECLEAAVVLNQ